MMNAYPRWSLLAAPLLAALGCSDPVPPPAQGAVTLYLGQTVTHVDGRTCPVTSTYQVAGKDSTTKMIAAPTTTDPGMSVISGQSGSTISCSVKGGKGNFTFSGNLYGITPQGDAVSISVSGGTIGADNTGTAQVAIRTPQLSTTVESTMPCKFTILNGSTGPQIKGGSMWASFSCDELDAAPSYACGVNSSSTIVFENCDGS